MQKELLSAYMDGEQVDVSFTQTLCHDEKLQQSWQAFHTVRAVMRKESAVFLGAEFTQKMAALIELEEIEKSAVTVSQPMPNEVENVPFVQKIKAFFAPMTQVAVAAGVCLVAVLGVQTYMNKSDMNNAPDTPILQTLPFNNSVQEVSYSYPAQNDVTSEQLEQKNRRLGSMLQHYELQRRMHTDNK